MQILRQGSGKLKQLSSVKAVGNSNKFNNLHEELRLHLNDRNTNQKFLIDSGSIVSIIPTHRFKPQNRHQNISLFAANSTQIRTHGTILLNIDSNLKRNFSWNFIVADVHTAIIGADFLMNYNLLIDLKNQQLINPTTTLPSKGKMLKTTHFGISTINLSTPLANILEDYKEITRPFNKVNVVKSNFAHRIITNGLPISERPRKWAGEKSTAARAEINHLLEIGAIRPSSSA